MRQDVDRELAAIDLPDIDEHPMADWYMSR
jgi:hypothetical protein